MSTVQARGRDISAYDSGVNYSAYDFIIGKFTESNNFVSQGALDRASATRAAGKVFSAYHFARPGSGAEQAAFFLSVQKPQPGDMPGWLDYEVSGLGIGFVNDFSNAYHAATGYWPGVYCNLSTYTGELQSGAGWRKAGQRLWIARYGAADPGVLCDIWQYQGGPDLDVAYTPLKDMIIGGTQTQENRDMAMTTLSGGRVAVTVRGTDSKIWVRVLDGTGGALTPWQNVGTATVASGVDTCTRNGADLWIAALDPKDHSVLLFTLPDAEKPLQSTVQDLGGVGIGGTPGITANGSQLFLSVAGTLPKAGEIYLNMWDGTKWRGWWDASGQAG